jgi:hypothetical protein
LTSSFSAMQPAVMAALDTAPWPVRLMQIRQLAGQATQVFVEGEPGMA